MYYMNAVPRVSLLGNYKAGQPRIYITTRNGTARTRNGDNGGGGDGVGGNGNVS